MLNKTHYLLDYFVATKAGDKLSGRSHSEIPLEVNTPAIPALLHQVQPRHAWPILRNRDNACNGPLKHLLFWKEQGIR